MTTPKPPADRCPGCGSKDLDERVRSVPLRIVARCKECSRRWERPLPTSNPDDRRAEMIR